MIDVRGKRVLVVGLARSGRAVARCLGLRGARVTVSDSKQPSAFQDVIPELLAQKVGMELGLQREETFLRHDLIVVSPGVPWDLSQLQAARAKGIPVVPEIEVASWYLSGRLVGISGSNGKTTTTVLLGKMLEASAFSTSVGGNIGVPLISAIDRVTPETIVVAELSSFQLEAIQSFRPHVAVLLNITPNHLDRHPTFEAYVAAKAKIFSNQAEGDYAVLNADDANVTALVPSIRTGRKIFFSRRAEVDSGVFVSDGQIRYRVGHLERSLLEVRDVALRGAFNLENVLAACAVACVLGADFEALRRAVREFRGVEHRLEFVRQIRGVEFYNDSKATSVDATSKALSAFERGVHLILGGKDKGAPYAPLRPLLTDRVRTVLLIGAAAERIARELDGTVELVYAGDLETAVYEAFKRAEPGDAVLLSPACASFDQFLDFEHRGRVFKDFVELLAREAASEALGTGLGDGPRQPLVPEADPQPKSEPEPEAEAEPRAEPSGVAPSEPVKRREEKALEPAYVYEVEAEEIPYESESQVRAESADVDEMIELQELRSPEMEEDEPLPFEVRSAAAGLGGKALSGPSSTQTESTRGSDPFEAAGGMTGPEQMRSNKQGRLPGI